jgi:hypothetical protein
VNGKDVRPSGFGKVGDEDALIPALEIVGFSIALATAIWSWREDPRRTVVVATKGGYAIGVSSLVIAFTGVPLALYRFRRATISQAVLSCMSSLHHQLGHMFILIFVPYWPVLAVVCFMRPRSWARRAFLGGGSLVGLFCFQFLPFTGYLLPRGLPRSLTKIEAYQSVRFAVLHVLTVPVFTLAVFSLIIWRHAKALRTWRA